MPSSVVKRFSVLYGNLTWWRGVSRCKETSWLRTYFHASRVFPPDPASHGSARHAGLSQSDFAKALAVSEDYIQAIETGHRQINENLIESVSFVFGITPDSLKAGYAESYMGAHIPLAAAIKGWIQRLRHFHEQSSDTDLVELFRLGADAARQRGHAVLFRVLFFQWFKSTSAKLGLDGTPLLDGTKTFLSPSSPVSHYFGVQEGTSTSPSGKPEPKK